MFLLLIAAPLLRADDQASIVADIAWLPLDDRDGVALFCRSRAGTGVKEFKGAGLIDAPPAAVEKVLADVADYPTFMPYVTETRVLAQEGDWIVTYQRLALPFVANRDYTVKVEHSIVTGTSGEIIYRDAWLTDNDAGPPKRHGTVRVQVNEGSWLLEPAGPAGGSTQATYEVFCDTGGFVPAFVTNRASQAAIPKLFDAIRKQVGQVPP